MQERPLIYVSRITNLSDARYCAGMGVDMLGFVVDPADPDYVSPEAYQQMVGWISGPARVIETGPAIGDLHKVRDTYAPEFLHVSSKLLPEIPDGPWKLIVETKSEDLGTASGMFSKRKDIAHVLVIDAPVKRIAAPPGISILAGSFAQGSVIEFLEACGASGVALRGSREVIPGLKDYDHLSQVLEELNG